MKALLVCIALLAIAATAAAADKPDFSGVWVLNADKSKIGAMPPDIALTIRHKDPEFLVTQDSGGQTIDFKLAIDGKEHRNPLPDGELTSTLVWDGSVLKMAGVMSTGGGEFKYADKMTLAGDGKTFRLERRFSGPDGDQDWVLVFDKQPQKQ